MPKKVVYMMTRDLARLGLTMTVMMTTHLMEMNSSTTMMRTATPYPSPYTSLPPTPKNPNHSQNQNH